MPKIKTNGLEQYKVLNAGNSGLSVNDIITKVGLDLAGPFNLMKVQRIADHIPYAGLKFTANTAGSTVALGTVGGPSWSGSYSIDDGRSWTSYVPNTTGAITLTNIGDEICFKGDITNHFSFNNYLKFSMTGSISVAGNIMSMHTSTGFESITTIDYRYAFSHLFEGCTALTSAENLTLPATTLKDANYCYLFANCTNLISAPSQLPAETLTINCYESMFYKCTALTSAPVISATTLAGICCYKMFESCSALKINNTGAEGTLFFTCPEIPSAISAYAVTDMFKLTGGSYTSSPVKDGQYYYY